MWYISIVQNKERKCASEGPDPFMDLKKAETLMCGYQHLNFKSVFQQILITLIEDTLTVQYTLNILNFYFFNSV